MSDAPRPIASRRAAGLALAVALGLVSCATESDRAPLGAGDATGTTAGRDEDAAREGAAGGTGTSAGTSTTVVTRAGEAPPVPADPRAAFERAIEQMRGVVSADLMVELAVESGPGSTVATLDGEFDAEDVGKLQATIERNGRPVELEVRSDGRTAWVRSDAPSVAGVLPGGATWVEAPVGQLRDAGVFSGIDDTFDVLPVLRGIGDAADAGTVEIGGDPVRLLRGNVDWQAALAAASPEEAQLLQQSISFTGDTRPTAFVATVGLDGEGRARRLVLDVTASSASSPTLGEIHLRLGYNALRLDHDVAVPDAPPPANTVALAQVPGALDALAAAL